MIDRWTDSPLPKARQTLRALARAPGFAVTAVLTLAIGIGAATAVFSVVYGVLLKPLPYPESEELVSVLHSAPGAPGLVAATGELRPSTSMYVTYAEQNRTFEQIGLWTAGAVTVAGAERPELVSTVFMTAGVLRALSVPPLLGRWLTSEDEQRSAASAAMLSHGYWQRSFGSDPSVIGRSITIDSRPVEVVGVMPKGFRIPGVEADLIAPIVIDRSLLTLPPFGGRIVARLKPGVTIAEADADVARMLPIWMDSWPYIGDARAVYGEGWQIAPALRSLKEDVVGNVGNVLWVVMGTIGIVLLIACANVANLMLVRMDGRRRELAVRAALGAGAWQISRTLLAESVGLALLGGGLGAVLAFGGVELLTTLGPATLPRLDEIAVDGRALGFATTVSLIAGVALGLVPLVKHEGPRVGAVLRSGGRGSSQGKERHRTQNLLVVAQVALALVLLVSSGLMIRTFQAMHAVEPGFSNPSQLQTLRIGIPADVVPDAERVTRMQNDMMDAIEAIPGVVSAAFASGLPLEGIQQGWDAIDVEGQESFFEGGMAESPPIRTFKRVSPGFFATAGTRLVAGREMTWTEVYDSRPVAIVSENLARELWGEASTAIGKRIRTLAPGSPWREIVGVAEDVREIGLDEAPPAIVYWPATVTGLVSADVTVVTRSMSVVVRSSRAGTASLSREIEEAVWSVDSRLPISSNRTMQAIYDESLARTSFTLVMLAIAGISALVLGIVGLYGVLAYSVTQRRREIAIRLALGAQQRVVLRGFVRDGLMLACVGLALGLGAAAAVTRLMSSLLFGVGAVDPLTYVAAALLLALVAGCASYLPARRASAVDPNEVLAAE